jgi:hypothetical protein
MTPLRLPFWEGSHFADKTFKKIYFIQVILKIPKGETEDLPWLHSGVKILTKKEEKCGGEP